MRSILFLVVLAVSLYTGINWATSRTDTPGGAVVLSIVAVIVIYIAISLILGIFGWVYRKVNESDY